MDMEAILEKHRDYLMSLENVVGVGEGEENGRPVIHVLVSRKVDRNALPASQVVPTMLEGVPIVVQDTGGPIEAQNF